MSTLQFRGDAIEVAEVRSLTVGGTIEVGDLFKGTINGRTIQDAANTTVVNTTASEFNTVWNASTIPEFAEITASNSASAVVTLTHDTPGVTFSVTEATTESNGDAADAQTFVAALVTAAAGPNVWGTASNWSGGVAPVDTDDVYIADTDVDILYDLSQTSIDLTSLNIEQSYEGHIGIPRINETDPEAPYIEYRQRYLAIRATTLNVGRGDGAGSGRLMIDTGSAAATTVNVYNTGTRDDEDVPAFLWKATHADSAFNINKGDAGIAYLPGEVATVATLRCGYTDNVLGDVTLVCGSGCTLTNVDQSGGTLTIQSGTTTYDMTDGVAIILAGAHTAINVDGGTLYYQSTGTLGTLKVGSGAVVDFSRDMRARTVSNCELHEGGTIRDPFKTVTWTNGIDLVRTSLEGVTLDFGTHLTVTPSAI